jgi:hypothetical protein
LNRFYHKYIFFQKKTIPLIGLMAVLIACAFMAPVRVSEMNKVISPSILLCIVQSLPK